MKTTIIYWSSTGNTEKMAHLIETGIKKSGSEVAVKTVSESSPTDIMDSDIVILGCSAMGVEEIDGTEMEPFINKHKACFKDKDIALFGSYGWGDGDWMASWESMMEGLDANLLSESLMVNETPVDDTADACVSFGAGIL